MSRHTMATGLHSRWPVIGEGGRCILAGHAPVQPVRPIMLLPLPVTSPADCAFRWEQR